MKRCYLAIGGNRGPSLTIFCEALCLLSKLPIFNIQTARLYLSNPQGISSHQLFFNSCLSFDTLLSPFELLHETKNIEHRLCKNKKEDGSRTIDLDFLFYGDLNLQTKNLILPHPHWKQRIFVLKPLQDLTNHIFLDVHFNIPTLLSSLQKEQSAFCEAVTQGAFHECKPFIQKETCSHFWSLCTGRGRRSSLCSQFSF